MKTIIIEYRKEHSLRERILLWLLGVVIPIHALFYERRKPWGMVRQDLLQYAPGTLGHELGHFLKSENLEPVPRVERHDAFHILLGFTTSLTDEAAMQFFLVGSGKWSPFTLATAAFTWLMMPDKWSRFKKEYKRGKQTLNISKWDFKQLLADDFEDIRKAIFKEPYKNEILRKKIAGFSNK